MKHLILFKLNESVEDKKRICDEAESLFKKLENKNGIHTVSVFRNCVAESNRFDCMIQIEMDCEALEYYKECEVHKYWKTNYSQYLEKKAIFDYC